MKKTRGPVRTAFILGAGIGIRLWPLTKNCPKPLLKIGDRPMITYAMDHLLSVGVERFIVNTHHCADAYKQAFTERQWRGRPIQFRYEPVLLDTAGGLKNIEDLLEADERLLIYNGDIIADLPLQTLIDAHIKGQAEATLVLRSFGPLLNVHLDNEGLVCDLRGLLGNPGVKRCQFTGIYLVERRFLNRLEPGRIESVVPIWVRMIQEQPEAVSGIVIDEGTWQDVGSLEEYEKANEGSRFKEQGSS
jgi:NDP-sugar pyrophosphorylase family protein